MTNDYRKGWRYKLRTDRNARVRRRPAVRRRVASFRRRSRKRQCASRARTACRGPLQVHHVGGIRPGSRLEWRCARHNQADAGNRQRDYTRPRRRRR